MKQNTASAQPRQRSDQNPRSDQRFRVGQGVAFGSEDIAVEQVGRRRDQLMGHPLQRPGIEQRITGIGKTVAHSRDQRIRHDQRQHDENADQGDCKSHRHRCRCTHVDVVDQRCAQPLPESNRQVAVNRNPRSQQVPDDGDRDGRSHDP